jgi:anti-sigma28 factor (negative regulator of flagellin synthesis)
MNSISLSTSTINPTDSILRPGEDSKSRQIEPKGFGRSPDRVELSDAARQAASDTSPVRLDVVSRVREQLASGTYESPVKTTLAIDAFTRALRGG